MSETSIIKKGCFTVDINENDKWDIECSLLPYVGEGDVPEEQRLLHKEVERSGALIKTLQKTKENIKEMYFNKLLSLAQVGLAGENPVPILSLETLEGLKEEICIKEGSRIKNSYMISLGICALVSISTLLALISVWKLHYLDKYLYVYIGAMVGTWVSFSARKLKLSFEELSIIESDGVGPFLRLVYIGICSIIIFLFFNSGLITIAIGNFNISEINNSIELQILLGIICGLVEYQIGTGLFNKATDILKF